MDATVELPSENWVSLILKREMVSPRNGVAFKSQGRACRGRSVTSAAPLVFSIYYMSPSRFVDGGTKHVLAKRGEYTSAYGAELHSAFLPTSAVKHFAVLGS